MKKYVDISHEYFLYTSDTISKTILKEYIHYLFLNKNN